VEATLKNSHISTERPQNIEIAFSRSGDRPAARYVSDTLVREEALDHGRLIGLYWSAGGQVQRENITAGLPGIDPRSRPMHVFELEIDGQSLHNRWDWVGASERKAGRPGTVEAVVELRHQVRPISVKVVTRLDEHHVQADLAEPAQGDQPHRRLHETPFPTALSSYHRRARA